MRSHEIDERGWPAEWAVDPGLADLLHHLQYDLVVGARDNILDDCAVGSPFGPFRLLSVPAAQQGRSRR